MFIGALGLGTSRVRFSTTTVEREGPRDMPGRLPRPGPPFNVSVFFAPVSSVRLSSLSAMYLASFVLVLGQKVTVNR